MNIHYYIYIRSKLEKVAYTTTSMNSIRVYCYILLNNIILQTSTIGQTFSDAHFTKDIRINSLYLPYDVVVCIRNRTKI